MVSCFSSVHGAHRGTPLCKMHLAESGRAQSPAPPHKSSSHKPEEPSSSLFEEVSLPISARSLDPVEPSDSRSSAPLLLGQGR